MGRMTRRAWLIGLGVLALAGLLAGAFQLGRTVERRDRLDARAERFTPFTIDPLIRQELEDRVGDSPWADIGALYDQYPPVLDSPTLDSTALDADPTAPDDPADRFAVWIEPDDGPRRQRVFEPDGTVIELRADLHDSDAGDYRELHLSDTQRALVTDAVLASGVTATETGELGRVGDGSETRIISVSGRVRSVQAGGPAREPGLAGDTAFLVDRLFDLSWLGPDIEAGAEPWTPASLTVWVEPGPPAELPDDLPAWPLDGPVLAETEGVDRGPGRIELPYRCLEGDDAAAVFALLQPERSAVVDDEGTPRRLRLYFDLPYFVVTHDVCT